MPKKKNSNIDASKTRQHHDYCGEEADTQLAFLLSVNEKKRDKKPTPEDGSDSDERIVDLVVGPTETDKDSSSEEQNLSTVDK